MYKSVICNSKEQVCEFLMNMYNLGYNPKMQVVAITQDLNKYTVFYEWFEDLEEPKSF